MGNASRGRASSRIGKRGQRRMLDVLGTELIEFEALSITPVTLILVAVLAALLLSFASSLKSARAEYMRNLFRETYHVVLDRDTLVKRRSPVCTRYAGRASSNEPYLEGVSP